VQVRALFVPVAQPVDREGVAKVVGARSDSPLCRFHTCELKQAAKRSTRSIHGQRRLVDADEESNVRARRRELHPRGQIAVEFTGQGAVKQNPSCSTLEPIKDLHSRVHRGAYRAQPSRRVYIPKADGRQRPLGIAALEDKIVQQAVVTILNQIYEVDFLGFSYGSRPGRSQHQALDALVVGIERRQVNWVLDADIRGFFDNVDHEWMLRFLRHRIADPRILRLIQKWLKAGISEDGSGRRRRWGRPKEQL
jgi:retron-type reverse transcriptase